MQKIAKLVLICALCVDCVAKKAEAIDPVGCIWNSTPSRLIRKCAWKHRNKILYTNLAIAGLNLTHKYFESKDSKKTFWKNSKNALQKTWNQGYSLHVCNIFWIDDSWDDAKNDRIKALKFLTGWDAAVYFKNKAFENKNNKQEKRSDDDNE